MCIGIGYTFYYQALNTGMQAVRKRVTMQLEPWARLTCNIILTERFGYAGHTALV